MTGLSFSFSVFSVLFRPFDLRAENLGMDLVVVKDVYLGIRFSVCHIVSVLWHMGGFTETSRWIRSKFSKDLENNLLDGNTS